VREVLAVVACVAGFCAAAVVAAENRRLTPERQTELVALLEHECGACHGMRLRGGLGPPLTPDVMASKPRVFLERTISDGRPGTPMPPWASILSRQEIAWLVERLQEGLSDDR
jgi:cytochrome c55X